jgi:hypothetical protein
MQGSLPKQTARRALQCNRVKARTEVKRQKIRATTGCDIKPRRDFVDRKGCFARARLDCLNPHHNYPCKG